MLFNKFNPVDYLLLDLKKIERLILKQREALDYALGRLAVFDPPAVEKIREIMKSSTES